MTKTTWTHRLEEWSHPKPASTMAVVALVLVAIALVLLALGGVALAQDPEAFDLWVLAIGLFLLAGALVGIGRSPDRNPWAERARSFSDQPSLAEAPAMTSPTSDPDFASRRATPTARSWASSDTIAGQYAEASRLRTGRAAARRPIGTDNEGSSDSTYPYTFSSSRGADWDPSRPPRRTAFETDMDQLRARVADLEAGRSGPAGATGFPGAAGGPGRVSAWGAGPPSTGVPTKRAARAAAGRSARIVTRPSPMGLSPTNAPIAGASPPACRTPRGPRTRAAVVAMSPGPGSRSWRLPVRLGWSRLREVVSSHLSG